VSGTVRDIGEGRARTSWAARPLVLLVRGYQRWSMSLVEAGEQV